MASSSGRPPTPPPARPSRSAPSQADDDPAVRSRRHALAVEILGKARKGDTEGLRKLQKKLVKAGSNLVSAVAGVPSLEGVNLLSKAIEWEKPEVCKYLIKDIKIDINAPNEHGYTPLMSAILDTKSEKLINLLLHHGADINKVYKAGMTALHIVINAGDIPMTKLLLRHKADVNAVCDAGTALHIATVDKNVTLIIILLDANADAAVRNKSGFIPLHVAVLQGSVETAHALLSKNNSNLLSVRGTAVHIAAEQGDEPMLRLLLEHSTARTDIPDSGGRLPIEVAAIHGWRDCVGFLLFHSSIVDKYKGWSIDQVIQLTRSEKLEAQDPLPTKTGGCSLKADADSAFKENDYAAALTLYTKAIEEFPNDPILYAKRCFCFLNKNEKGNALEDINISKALECGSSGPFYEQVAALITTDEYDQALKTLMSGLSLEDEHHMTGESSRAER